MILQRIFDFFEGLRLLIACLSLVPFVLIGFIVGWFWLGLSIGWGMAKEL